MRRNSIIVGLILCAAIVTCVAFSPSLQNGFTNCDDHDYVTQNQTITELSLKNIKTIFTTTSVFYIYHPLVLLSYAVEHHFVGLKPFLYHLDNLILHLINVSLVFLLIFMLDRNAAVAFFVALLFGIHPLRVESVAWVTERKDVLYAAFYLGSLICYLRYAADAARRKYYGWSLCLFIISLLSKPMAVTLPAVLVLLDYLNKRKIDRRAIVEKIPFFALSLIFSFVNMSSHYPADEARVEAGFTMTHKILNGFHGVLFHIGKLLAPVNLCCLYQHPKNFVAEIPIIYWLSPVIVAALCIAFLASARYSRKGLFGFLFFLVTILPVLQFLPVGGKSTPADRFTYLPAVGLFYLAGEFLYWLGWEKFKDLKPVRIGVIAVFAAVVAVFSFHTYAMCGVWKDSVTLWTNVLKYYPDNLVSLSNRGGGYIDRRDFDNAVKDLSEAIRIEPRYFLPYVNRGMAFAAKGDIDRSIADHTQAIQLNPRFAPAYYNRGNMYAFLKQFDKAIADYTAAIERQPLYAAAYNNRGSAYNDTGDTGKALADYSEAVRIEPRYGQAFSNRGNVRSRRGDLDLAIEDYSRAIALDPRNLDAYLGRAAAYARKGDYTMAWQDIDRIREQGYTVDPAFIEELRRVSGRR
ncbi:MAG TPA: tetratricopeptide repeat protein [bacterium]|nr:tetratricopeptide repeat protein [bacterium]